MMRSTRWSIPAMALLGMALATLPVSGQSQLFPCKGRCARLANGFIRADIGPDGSWVLGTTGGDPDTAMDDDRRLLYGFEPAGASTVGYGYTTVRVVGSRGVVDWVHHSPAPETITSDSATHVWRWTNPYRVAVTQTLALRPNRFTRRPDMAEARYLLRNEGTEAISIGLRALFDVKLDGNDGAPYFIPGQGTVANDREFLGSAVPDYWLAFASPRFDVVELRGMGVLRDTDFAAPDRLVIGRWSLLQNSRWDYEVDVTRVVTQDSAVAMYFDPVRLAPGATASRATAYGLYAGGGGEAFISAPLEASCGETFGLAFFVTNFGLLPLKGGHATIDLPPGLLLAPGEVLQKPLPEIGGGATASITWQLRVAQSATGPATVRVAARFDENRQFSAEAEIALSCPPTPTPTRTVSAPPTLVSPTVAATATLVPTQGRACASLVGRVPVAAVSDAVANPERVFGWRQPLNPALPPGPGNPLRTWLTVRDLGKAYHPIFNPLVYKAGCP
jgi:hypothetical protein